MCGRNIVFSVQARFLCEIREWKPRLWILFSRKLCKVYQLFWALWHLYWGLFCDLSLLQMRRGYNRKLCLYVQRWMLRVPSRLRAQWWGEVCERDWLMLCFQMHEMQRGFKRFVFNLREWLQFEYCNFSMRVDACVCDWELLIVCYWQQELVWSVFDRRPRIFIS
jgi:hypothetical protein